MVAPNGVAPCRVDLGGDLVSDAKLPFAHGGQVHARPGRLQPHNVLYGGFDVLLRQATGVRYLPARLQIEGGPVEDDVSLLAGSQCIDPRETRSAAVAAEQMGDAAPGRCGLVTVEPLRAEVRIAGCGEQAGTCRDRDLGLLSAAERRPGPGAGSLLLHRPLESLSIDVHRPGERKLRLFIHTEDWTVRKAIIFDENNKPDWVYYFAYKRPYRKIPPGVLMPRGFFAYSKTPKTPKDQKDAWRLKGTLAVDLNRGLTDAVFQMKKE